MAAKSDGVLKMKKSDVAFTPLQNSEHSGSVQGLHPGGQLDSAGTGDGDFANGESRCCGGGGSNSTCLRLGKGQQKYTVWDCLWIVAAVAVYLADVGTDVWLSVDYYLRHDYWWFGPTLFFVVLGSFSVQLFSFRWFVHDFSTEDGADSVTDCSLMDGNKLLSGSASHGDVTAQHHPATPQRQASTASKNTTTNSTASTALGNRNRKRSAYYSFCVWFGQSVIHIMQLGQIWRYFHTIYLGVRSRQGAETERWRYYWRMVYEFADVSMLHLLATFLESAPQLVLQLCIIIQTHKLQAVQGMTAAASLVSMAWALASYQKALRESRDDKKPISYLAVIIQFCWHFFTIAARVITFALFASVFQLYFGIFIVLHWCIMTFWIVHCETDFCISKWEEIVFDMVVGIIYIFSWFNVKEGRTRCRLFIYYLVILMENTALSALWYLYRFPQNTDAFAVPALCVIFSSFLTGIVFMLMYYAFFHPNGPRFGHSPSGQGLDLDPTAQFSTLPSEGATNSLRSNRGATTTLERHDKYSERDGCMPVFQVRSTVPSTPSSRAPRLEENVIKIDLCRNRYPAWERHVLDRSIRKAILAIDCSLTPPRLQYKDDALVQERLEYETTL
ncbi:XK-related protein 4 [Maylandia zebra]|uniref:XK-related protein n=3 Tax=Haplochromini TaxID=319058 RepID=A0A9Y3RXA4_9CICH|nr:PREDICTED: XK-related protein 4 [Pundamilia nyererei]XP_014266730.1 XK-related protein 4 [Maylandia zebra]XP_026006148.1 XK-related protein 4 [Astatotilapia calliptera]XP_039892936.1 XK-related protein 4 [Simochromis diagramma]